MKSTSHSFPASVSIIIALIGLFAAEPLTAQDWYDADWQFRRKITVDNPGGSALANYQVRIDLDNSSFDFTDAQSDGNDIRITAEDKTSLIPFWIEAWDAVGEEGTIWVKVPQIPVAGTSVYLYYGNPSPSIPAPDPVETPPIGPFTRDLNNPINPIGDPGAGASLLAENIVYDEATGHYWMVFANYRGGSPGVGLVWSDNPSDATSWNWFGNVYTHTGSGSFAPHILKENGTWYIFFAILPNIVYMTSTDIDGPYSSPTVVLSPSETWETYRVDEPYVFQRNDGKWIMAYMGDIGGAVEQVGYASSDAITGPYTKYPGNPCIAFGPSGSFDAGTIADPWVYEFNGVYYIGYTVSPTTSSPWQTAVATTTDWLTFTKLGVIFPLAGSGWDAVNSFRGAVTRIGDTYVFSYTGDAYRMGIATQPVLMDPSGYINNPEAVFDFFDGFEGTGIDLNKWTFSSGSSSQTLVSGGLITLTASGTFVRIDAKSTFGMDYIGETYARHPSQGTQDKIMELGFADGAWNTVRIVDDFKLGTTYWQRQAKLSGPVDDFVNMAQTADQDWHVFTTYRQSPNIAGFRIDDNPIETVSTFVPVGNLPPFLMSYGDGNQFIVDWTRVRKWAATAPLVSVGGQQVQTDPIVIEYTKTDVSACFGDSDGSINISVTGGSGSYTYLWSPGGETTEDITGLPAGIYSVMVLDSYDSEGFSGDIEITQPDELIPDYTVTSPAMCSTCTATVLISATGGTPPYTGTGSFEQGVGTVIYSVTDDNGCAADISVTINEPAPWYDETWQHRREVGVTNAVGSILTEYQVMVTLDNSFNFNTANEDGSDIRFTLDDGTTLIPFWIEEWDPAGQQAVIWIKVPQIPTAGTSVFLYYGNPSPATDLPVPVEVPPAGPFTRAAGNPIIPSGATGSSLLAENIVYDPVTGHYWMCLANYSQAAISLCYSDNPTDPGSWVWSGNVVTTFTQFYSGAPHLIYHADTWYLFYADRPNIMVATASAVAGPYTINPTPVLSPSGPSAWDSFRVDEPYVFYRASDSKWVLIYMGDAGSVTEQVGYATADDITGPYTAYAGNPCLAFGPSGTYDAGTIADPWVYEYYGVYYVGYTVSPTKNSPWQTALATTTNWIDFTKQGVIFPLAISGWDAVNSFRGAVTRIGDDYVFSYTGDSYQMGIATQPVFMAPESIINNADAVFDFYDGFDGTALDGSKWTFINGSAAQASVAGGNLTLTHTGGNFPAIVSQSVYGMNYLSESRARHPEQGTLNMVVEMGWNASFGDIVRIVDDFPGTLPDATTTWNRQSKLSSQSGDPGWQAMAQQADQDWHMFRIGRQGTGTAGFQIDDNTLETVSSSVPTTNLPVFLMSYTESAANHLIVDWTRVRKWAGPDPSTVVGTEQTINQVINVAIYNTTCGDFEVRLKPNSDLENTTVTNIQFTVKWPSISAVDLTGFSSGFGVTLQGGVVSEGGMNYAVFASSANIPIDWTGGTEYTVLNFSHDHSSTGYADFEIDEGSWASANNGEFYVELLGEDHTGMVTGNAANVYLGRCGEFKVLLQGPFNETTGMMNTGLSGNIPLEQPYNVDPWMYDGGESPLAEMDAGVVDWVLVELRSDEYTILEQKAALLLDDGTIVQHDNTAQGVHFDNTPEGSSFYVVVHHRNHMPVMTADPVVFNGTLVDFTDETACYGSPGAEIELEEGTGIFGMIAGDINSNGRLSYSGPGNDRGLIVARIASELNTTNINDIAYGYFDEDVLMDYSVKYIGGDNDRAIMIPNLATLTGTPFLNAVYESVVPGFPAKSGSIQNGPIHIFVEEVADELRVKITTDETIEHGIVDNVQFTLSWEAAANDLVLPVLEQGNGNFGLQAQGKPVEIDGRMHQTYVSVIPVELPNPFVEKDEAVLITFIKNQDISFGGKLSIANRKITEPFNGSYYISLWGADHTGTVKTIAPGIDELGDGSISIYPNPVTTGILHVVMNLPEAQTVTVSVMDIQGTILESTNIQAQKGAGESQMNVTHLHTGMYYILVRSGNLNTIKKIVIIK